MTSLYLFTIFNSTQGFFIFVFYGALSFVTTRGKSNLVATPSPFTNTTGKKSRELAVSTSNLHKKLLRLQLSRSLSDNKQNTTGETWITSCSDVQLDFGNFVSGFPKPNIEGKVCITCNIRITFPYSKKMLEQSVLRNCVRISAWKFWARCYLSKSN